MNSKAIARLLGVLNKIEDWLLISMLSVMVILAVTQIFYRNIAGGGVAWIDPMLRMLVLWVALAGAVIATRTDNHIRIDVFARYVSGKYYAIVQRVVFAYCVLICGFIAWHATRFVSMEYEFAAEAFIGIPVWATQLIIPVAFALMAFRYVLLLISPPEREQT